VHLKKGEGGLPRDFDVMMDQARAIDNRRLRRDLGVLSRARLNEVERGLAVLLDLESARDWTMGS